MLIAVRVCLSLSVVQPYCLFPCCMCVTRRNNTSNFRELLFCHCSVHFHWSFFYYFWMSDFYVFHVAPNSWDRSPLNVSMWSICWIINVSVWHCPKNPTKPFPYYPPSTQHFMFPHRFIINNSVCKKYILHIL